jgi:hypothetical protein
MSKAKSKPTQCDLVLDYIEKHGSITQREADAALGVARLASRICDLKRKGYVIVAKGEKVQNRRKEPCYIKRYSFGEGVNERV